MVWRKTQEHSTRLENRRGSRIYVYETKKTFFTGILKNQVRHHTVNCSPSEYQKSSLHLSNNFNTKKKFHTTEVVGFDRKLRKPSIKAKKAELSDGSRRRGQYFLCGEQSVIFHFELYLFSSSKNERKKGIKSLEIGTRRRFLLFSLWCQKPWRLIKWNPSLSIQQHIFDK